MRPGSLMDISLVHPKSPFLINQKAFPPLGILYLSSFFKAAGARVQCVDLGIGQSKDDVKFNMVGISFTTPQRKEAYELAKHYKSQGRYTLAGGPHATYMAAECLDNGFDGVHCGDGELFFGRLQGVDHKRLDWLPVPDRKALPIRSYTYTIDGEPATPIITSRGCPYSCSFCAGVSTRFRMHSADRVSQEILHINKSHGFKAFMIFDDVFIANKERLRDITGSLKDTGFVFRCFGRANLLDIETCELLKKMGVVDVGIGVESGSDEILSFNMKGTTRAVNTKAIENLHRFGIRAKAFIIIGLPGESHKTVAETIDWIEKVGPDDIDVTIFQPLPGSPIFSNPDKWGIKFNYDGGEQWYKGTPGKYEGNVCTKELTSDLIVAYRDNVEHEYKRKELLK